MPTTYIIGHQKPDTDAVVAAMALAALFRQQAKFSYDLVEPVIADPVNPETSYLLERFGVDAPRVITAEELGATDQVVLVDHNEPSQRLANLPENQITEIIDHHKVNLNLTSPIFLTFKPWGSSSTIVYYLMKQHDFVPEPTLAALMLAAILSDTVGFKSATTTEKDHELAQELAELAGIEDLTQFTTDIMKAKSDLSSLSPEEMIQNDYKVFDFGQKTFISQIETVDQAELLTERKDELLTALAKMKETHQVQLAFTAISDVLQVNTKLLLAGEAEIAVAEQAFGGKTQDSVLDIGPKLSRKKEIAPAIEKVL